jgi:hypothetical protein
MIEVITIERSAIDRLISAWPCHGISNRVDLIVAAFGDNGDLIDLEVCDEADVMLEPDAYDGPAMVQRWSRYWKMHNATQSPSRSFLAPFRSGGFTNEPHHHQRSRTTG